MTTNGKSKLIYYLLGIIQVLVIAAGSYWIGRVEKVEGKLEDQQEAYGNRALQIETRITRAESNYDEILRRLDRIERKVDR